MTQRARWVWGIAVVLLWITWPTTALADTCRERANAIVARRVGPNVPDPDCKRAGVIGATLMVTVAAAAVGVAAVGLGLGLAGSGVGIPTASSGAGAAPVTTGEGAAVAMAGPTTAMTPLAAGPATGTGTTLGTGAVVEAPRGASTTTGAGAIAADIAIASILKGPAAFNALERAGLVERVRDQPGTYRLRAALETTDWQGDRSTGVGGVAYYVRADGTLDPNIAAGMFEAGPTAPIPDSATLTTSAAEALDALLRNLPEGELRQAVIELLNPAKLVGMKFDDVERFREDYEEAKQLENPSQAQQTQDYVIYTFSTAFGLSREAARALLEMPTASWNVLATFVASLG